MEAKLDQNQVNHPNEDQSISENNVDLIAKENNQEEVKISKRQMKKQAKQQKWQEKQLNKEKSKDKKKKSKASYAHLERFNKYNKHNGEGNVEDAINQNINNEERKDDEQKKTSKKEKQALFKDLCKQGPKYIIDCEFESLMNDRELKSLSQQLAYCHSVNKRINQPLNIMLSGVEEKLKTMISKSNCQQWAVDIRYQDKYFDIVEDKSKLVYLTADSENLIDKLDSEMTYIVGGIVDHNRYKLLTYKKATEQGIKHARLPIRENIQLSHSAVLTVNHVFEIIAQYYEKNGNWKEALLAAIPERKRKSLEENKNDNDNKLELE